MGRRGRATYLQPAAKKKPKGAFKVIPKKAWIPYRTQVTVKQVGQSSLLLKSLLSPHILFTLKLNFLCFPLPSPPLLLT